MAERIAYVCLEDKKYEGPDHSEGSHRPQAKIRVVLHSMLYSFCFDSKLSKWHMEGVEEKRKKVLVIAKVVLMS